MGIPRIVTNALSALLWLIAWFYLTLKCVPAGEKEKFRILALNPFILTAFGAVYIAFLTREFLSFKYKVKGRPLDKTMRENWSEPFVKVSLIAGASALLLSLVGFLVYRSQLK
jgi:hypothetical protein